MFTGLFTLSSLIVNEDDELVTSKTERQNLQGLFLSNPGSLIRKKKSFTWFVLGLTAFLADVKLALALGLLLLFEWSSSSNTERQLQNCSTHPRDSAVFFFSLVNGTKGWIQNFTMFSNSRISVLASELSPSVQNDSMFSDKTWRIAVSSQWLK